jgi:hypothetical protein
MTQSLGIILVLVGIVLAISVYAGTTGDIIASLFGPAPSKPTTRAQDTLGGTSSGLH